MEQSPRSVVITVSSDYGAFNIETAKIWAFGYKGRIVFQDGHIVMDSQGMLLSSQYMVLLVKFERDFFETGSHIPESFDDILQKATKGSDYSDEPPLSGGAILLGILGALVALLAGVFPFIVISVIIIAVARANNVYPSASAGVVSYSYGAAGNRLPPFKETKYWREIPCQKDLEISYWVSLLYAVSPESDVKTGVIGAFLLKWLKNGNIDVISLPKNQKPLGKDDNYAIAFISPLPNTERIETELMAMMTAAKGTNTALQPKQFQYWCERNHSRMQDWYKHLEIGAMNKLGSRGLVSQETVPLPGAKVLGIQVVKNRAKTVYHIQASLKEEATKMAGLKKFLLEFSIIGQRTVYEVRVWEEYLIFAQLLGIADKVREQLRKVYPEFGRVSRLDTRTDNVGAFVGSIAASGYSGMKRGDSRSASGGGGSSSSGGGGGSRGGGSGGGFR
jgi:uncharacterized membrane protein YgcG